MSQYIDKDALVAEINRRLESLVQEMNKLYYASNYKEWKSVVSEYRSLLSFLNTLEVKEVDLVKELDLWVESNVDDTGHFNTLEFAKYFFELGLKVVQNNS